MTILLKVILSAIALLSFITVIAGISYLLKLYKLRRMWVTLGGIYSIIKVKQEIKAVTVTTIIAFVLSILSTYAIYKL